MNIGKTFTKAVKEFSLKELKSLRKLTGKNNGTLGKLLAKKKTAKLLMQQNPHSYISSSELKILETDYLKTGKCDMVQYRDGSVNVRYIEGWSEKYFTRIGTTNPLQLDAPSFAEYLLDFAEAEHLKFSEKGLKKLMFIYKNSPKNRKYIIKLLEMKSKDGNLKYNIDEIVSFLKLQNESNGLDEFRNFELLEKLGLKPSEIRQLAKNRTYNEHGWADIIIERMLTLLNQDGKRLYTIEDTCKVLQHSNREFTVNATLLYKVADLGTKVPRRNLTAKEILELADKFTDKKIYSKLQELHVSGNGYNERGLTIDELKNLYEYLQKNPQSKIEELSQLKVFDKEHEYRYLSVNEIMEFDKFLQKHPDFDIKSIGKGIPYFDRTLGRERLMSIKQIKASRLSPQFGVRNIREIPPVIHDIHLGRDRLMTLGEMKICPKGEFQYSQQQLSNGESVLTTQTDNYIAKYYVSVEDNITKIHLNSKGKIKQSEVIAHSKEHPEYSTIETLDSKGNILKDKDIAQVSQTTKGLRYNKEFHSSSGYTTKQQIISRPKSSRMLYQLTNKDGEALNIDRRWRQLDANHYQSVVNGQKFDMLWSKDSVVCSKLDEQGKVIESITIDSSQIDPATILMLKKIHGDYLFKIKQMGTKIKYIPNSAESAFYDEINTISIGNEPAIFMHELGHAIDWNLLKKLHTDKTLQAIHDKELEQMMKTASPQEKKAMEYFTKEGRYQENSEYAETIAEMHEILSGQNISRETSYLGLRTIILQRYFPETMEYIAKKLAQLG